MENLVNITDAIDTYMYTYFLVFLLVIAGLYFTVRTRFVQFRGFRDMIRHMTERKHVEGKESVSSFQAMMVSTASRVGTGNIAGVATAIAVGGPGAVFWMWVMATVGSASAFVESTLAQIWKIKGKDGEFRGGPAYYIKQALGSRAWGVVFAISLILCFGLGFNGLQTYNMSSSLDVYISSYLEGLNLSTADFDAVSSMMVSVIHLSVGIIISVVLAFILFGGQRLISIITSVLVPVMAIGYILLAVVLTAMNFGLLPDVFGLIFREAFDFASITGGFAGSMIVWGIKRGLFSNEAGMGSAPNAAASASVSHPVKQGLIQCFSVFLDTMVICTCSAVMVMFFVSQDTSIIAWGGGEGELANGGMALVQGAMENGFGQLGLHFMTFAIFAFAFSSLIGNYYYAESNFKFITSSKPALYVFRILCCVVVFFGAQSNLTLAWNLADIFMGFEAIVNIVVILILGKWALKALADYEQQKRAGKDPVFVAESIEGMPATECWHVAKLEEPEGENPIVETLFPDGE